MSTIRPPAVADMFYPAAPEVLTGLISDLLAEAETIAARRPALAPKALIVPHAGYMYSGPIAAAGYATLRAAAEGIRRVVLMGPCHRVPLRGLAVPSNAFFATPLGNVPVDRAAVDRVARLPCVKVLDETHAEEHSLEVHLPFIQHLLKDVSLVPVVAGDARADEVAAVFETVWGGDETLIVVSSDLSHYLPYTAAQALDAKTCKAIEELDPAAIGWDQACGRVPISGLLVAAKRHRLQAITLDLRNSGDTAGDRARVVGYGAWIFTRGEARKPAADGGEEAGEDHGQRTSEIVHRHGATLLDVALTSIDYGLQFGKPLAVHGADFAPLLWEPGASFVTLKLAGQLRGCIGSPEPRRPLVEDVAENGFAAAFCDPRFPGLSAEEREDLEISLSLLTPPEPLHFGDEDELLSQLRPGEDGLVIQRGRQRALFLPQVWHMLPQPRLFLDQLKVKAGLSPREGCNDLEAWRFGCYSISSTDQVAGPATG